MAYVSEVAVGHRRTATTLPKVGTVVAGKYRIDREIGHGGMGAVFAAAHVVTGRRFALKWLLDGAAKPSAVERLLQEAKAAGRVRHPNVIDVFDFCYDGDTPFLVLELLEGVSLAERLRSGPLLTDQALAIFGSILRGVAAAHRCGVIHRDVKPENIVLARSLDGQEVPVIVDFGISKLNGPESVDGPAFTERGAVLGTPAFMAPEQLGGGPVDERSDVYSLGVLLYTMLAGTPPFQARGRHPLLAKIAGEGFASLAELRPDLPERVVLAVSCAMSHRPDDRFADADSFADALALRPDR